MRRIGPRRRSAPRIGRRAAVWALATAAAVGLLACGVRSAVSLRFQVDPQTPPDASVTIDEQFIGVLAYVASRGVRLPEGEHRITIEREGYFPWDRIVVSDRKPIHLDVRMKRIPD